MLRLYCMPDQLLPNQLYLNFSHRIQHSLRPVRIIRPDYNDTKTVVIAFNPYTFGIVDMQINVECRRKL